jgi:hypothetical protein
VKTFDEQATETTDFQESDVEVSDEKFGIRNEPNNLTE